MMRRLAAGACVLLVALVSTFAPSVPGATAATMPAALAAAAYTPPNLPPQCTASPVSGHTRVVCQYQSGPSDGVSAPWTWTVPSGVRRIHVDLAGGQGGSADGVPGGLGGGIGGDVDVSDGQLYDISAGNQGGLGDIGGGWPDGGIGGWGNTNGKKGCGGGGSTRFSRRGDTSWIAIAAGGGGCGGVVDGATRDDGTVARAAGGSGGDPGMPGDDSAWQSGTCNAKGLPGGGGSSSGGGARGETGEYYDPGAVECRRGASNAASEGGSGFWSVSPRPGGRGGDAQGDKSGGGGGGGGGFFGGGGGGGGNQTAVGAGGGGAGGGGASHIPSGVFINPSNYNGSNGGNGWARISYDLANTTTIVYADPPPNTSLITAGTPFTLRANVISDSSNVPDPAAGVAFSAVVDGASRRVCDAPGQVSYVTGTAPGTSRGMLSASCTLAPTWGGFTQFVADYGGGQAASPSSSALYVTLHPMATTTVLEHGDVNGTSTLTATVSGNSSSVPISGVMNFSTVEAGTKADVQYCAGVGVTDNHDGTATATCELSPVAGSEVDYVATYIATVDTAGSQSAPLHVSVPRSDTTTALTLSSSTASFGETVTATAAVHPAITAALDGTTAFLDGGVGIAGCGAVPVQPDGSATCTWRPGGGAHTITAAYAGGTQANPSTSPGAPLSVGTSTPAVALTASPTGGSIVGQQVTLTAAVTVGGSAVSGTTATFLDGGSPIVGCTAVAVSAGQATCSLLPAAGDHVFTVTTASTADVDAGAASLSGPSTTYRVGLQPTSTVVALTAPAPTPDPVPAGTAVTATATVTGSGSPTGAVAFTDNGQSVAGCGARPVGAGGKASCTWTPSAGVSHSVTAAYTGGGSWASSATASPLVFGTGRFASTTALTVSPTTPSPYGALTTLTAAVSSSGPTPSGTLTFTDGGIPVSACGTPAGPSATCTLRAGPGSHSWAAVYSGDPATAGSSSATISSVITAVSTGVTATATVQPGGLSFSATVSSPSDPALSPVGTVRFEVDGSGTVACTATLAAMPGGGSTGSCTYATDTTVAHTVDAGFVPTDTSAYGASSTTTTYTPAATCSAAESALVSKLSGSATVVLSAGALGSVTLHRSGAPPGSCTGGTALALTADATLFNGTLVASGVSGSLTAGGGLCLTAGTFSLPASWNAPTVSISTPICFALSDTGVISAVASGGLTASMPAGSFPFVAFPNAPPTSLSFGFTDGVGGTELHASFRAGAADSPVVALALDVAADGAFTGSLTTPGLTVLGQSLADLHVTVTGGGGAPLRFDGGVTLGPIEVAPGLTISTVTVGIADTGFSLAGTARIGVAGHTVDLDVAGSVSDSANWSLSLSATGGPLWEPVGGLLIQPDFAGTVSSTGGTVTWQVTAGGSTLATWSPAPGATVTIDQVGIGRPGPTCAATPPGAHDLTLALGGSLALNGVSFDISGCVDLALGTFHLDAAAQDVVVTSGLVLTGAHLGVDAAVSGTFHVTGGATASVTAGGDAHTLAVSFEFSSDGTLVIGGSVDLTPWGAPVRGYVAYASSAVTGFDTGDPTVGDGGLVDLAAGLTAVATWTPSAGTADVLQRAGFTLGPGGQVDLAATLSPTAGVTFHAALAAPGGMPFLTLPGGATLTGASLDFADGALTLVVDAAVPMPGGAAPAVAHLEITIATDGAFSGSASLTGLVVFGQVVDLSGSITATRPDGTLQVAASITAFVPGPFAMPGAASVTLSNVTVSLGTGGVGVSATADFAGRGGLTITGAFSSLSDWSLAVTSTPLTWSPAPQVTLTAQLSGSISRSSGVVTYEVSASNPSGDLFTFTPVSGFTVAVHSVRLGNGTARPAGCHVAAPGNVWLYVDGSATLTVASASGTATAAGCFDLTSGQVAVTADASGMSVSVLDGHVVLHGPRVTVSRTGAGYAVDAEVTFEVHFPTGPTFSQTATLSLRTGGTFVVGVRTNLSNWLGSAGGTAYLYYSSAAVQGYDTGDPTVGRIDLVSGITFAVKLSLPGNVAGELSTIGLASPGGATLTAVGTADFSRSTYTLRIRFDAGIGGQTLFTTPSGVSLALDSGYLKLTVAGSQVSFGLGLEATLHVPSATGDGGPSSVRLVGEITVSTTELKVSLQLGDCHSGTGWTDAFGVSGLTIQCAAVQGGLALAGPPLPTFGLMGTITSLPPSVADTIGYVNGSPMSFAFNLNPFLLSISIGEMDSPNVALRPLKMLGMPDVMEVRYASLYISPTGATIGQEVYPAGFGFAFQASIQGVSVNVVAKIDPVARSISFDGSVDRFTVGPLTLGPVSIHFKAAAPSTFEFTFDGAMQLGPGEVDLGAVRIGGSLAASVHLSVSTSEISAWFTASVSAYVAAYVPHSVCYYKGALPYPCDWWWERTGFDFTLGRTGFSLTSDGLTVSFSGYSLTLPFDGSSPTSTSQVAFHGETPAPAAAVYHGGSDPPRVRTAELPALPRGGGRGATLPAASAAGVGSRAQRKALPAAGRQDVPAPPSTTDEHPYVIPPPTGGAVIQSSPPPASGSVIPLDDAGLPVLRTGRMDGAWSAAAPMRLPRALPVVVPLPDGRVLVAGGATGDGVASSAEVYDPVAGTWTPTASMRDARVDAASTVLPDGRILVAGGSNGSTVLRTAEVYDPGSGRWSTVDPMGTARRSTSAVALSNGSVLVAGGADVAGRPLATAEVFDPSSGRWRTVGSMGTPRAFAGLAPLAGGGALAAGGMTDRGISATAERYDAGSRTWTPAAAMAEPRALDTVTVLDDGRVLLAGATNHGSVYDPRTDTWARTGGMAGVHPQGSAVRLGDGRIYLAGGSVDGHGITTTEVYDPSKNDWQRGPDLVAPVAAGGAVLLPNGAVLLAAGADGPSSRADAQVYGTAATPKPYLREVDRSAVGRGSPGASPSHGTVGKSQGLAMWWVVGAGLAALVFAGVFLVFLRRNPASQ